MRIFINDVDFQLSGNTLIDLVTEYCTGDSSGIAIAVNETVIPKNTWNSYILEEGDSVLIITPAQGG